MAQDDLVDYEDEEIVQVQQQEVKKGSYVGIHATGFRDFLLKVLMVPST